MRHTLFIISLFIIILTFIFLLDSKCAIATASPASSNNFDPVIKIKIIISAAEKKILEVQEITKGIIKKALHISSGATDNAKNEITFSMKRVLKELKGNTIKFAEDSFLEFRKRTENSIKELLNKIITVLTRGIKKEIE